MTSRLLQQSSFIVIALYPESNCTCRKNHFFLPLNYIDITRTTHTSLDVMLEKQIEDYWNGDGPKSCQMRMDRIHKICSTEGKATGRFFMVWEQTYKETNNFSSCRCMARYMEI